MSGTLGALAVVAAAVVRIYLGWAYVGNRLLSAAVEYEETGWSAFDLKIACFMLCLCYVCYVAVTAGITGQCWVPYLCCDQNLAIALSCRVCSIRIQTVSTLMITYVTS